MKRNNGDLIAVISFFINDIETGYKELLLDEMLHTVIILSGRELTFYSTYLNIGLYK
jgi:hypothetical protein